MRKKNEFMTIKTTFNFINIIEKMISEGHTPLDAVEIFCRKNNIEIESVAVIIKSSPKLKAKFRREAEKLNLLPKTLKLL
jgi:hypothetical protein